MEEKKLTEKLIAITDLETTGLDPVIWKRKWFAPWTRHPVEWHEIIEIGVVIAAQDTLEIVETWEAKVKPEHIKTAQSAAMAVNGYSPDQWKESLRLKDALQIYADKTAGTVFCSQNASFDSKFLDHAFKKTGIVHAIDFYHAIDTRSLAWQALRRQGLEKFNLNSIAKFLGIEEEPKPHRAINGVMVAYKIYTELMKQKQEWIFDTVVPV
ncbi:MAG: 3'-5' exonuclease [Parcubacteria group bacterium]|nr:3'-5' exonuclease [Parcubacteria group bacterium]